MVSLTWRYHFFHYYSRCQDIRGPHAVCFSSLSYSCGLVMGDIWDVQPHITLHKPKETFRGEYCNTPPGQPDYNVLVTNACGPLWLPVLQDIADEWGMGMNGDKLLPIHPQADEWGWIKDEWYPGPIHSSFIHPLFYLSDGASKGWMYDE